MIHESSITIAGRDLNVAVAGDEGPPLVLLHGVARAWQDFAALIASLAERWQVFAIDFRGHGRSDHAPGKYAVIDYCADVIALLEGKVPGTAAIYGHSMGAMVAAAVAAEMSERVRGIILEDPPFDTMGPRIGQTPLLSYFEQLKALAETSLSVSRLASAMAEIRLANPGSTVSTRLGDVRDAASLRFGAKCLTEADPAILEPIVAGTWLNGYDRAQVLARINCPVLLLQGNPELGGMLIDEDAREVEQTCVDCTRVTLAEVGHHIHATQPETTLRLVHSFLESLPNASPRSRDRAPQSRNSSDENGSRHDGHSQRSID